MRKPARFDMQPLTGLAPSDYEDYRRRLFGGRPKSIFVQTGDVTLDEPWGMLADEHEPEVTLGR